MKYSHVATLIFLTACSFKSYSDCLDFEKSLGDLVENKKVFNVEKLEKCLSKSDLEDSQYYLGLIYLLGINTPINYEKGINYLFSSANEGNIKSLVALGQFYIIDNDPEIFTQGVALLKIGMERGNDNAAMSLYRIMVSNDIAQDKDVKEKYIELFKKGYDEAVLFRLESAIKEAIKTDDANKISSAFEEFEELKLNPKTKGKIHFLLARAYITENTAFHDMSRVKAELKKAQNFGHEEASRLVTVIEAAVASEKVN